MTFRKILPLLQGTCTIQTKPSLLQVKSEQGTIQYSDSPVKRDKKQYCVSIVIYCNSVMKVNHKHKKAATTILQNSSVSNPNITTVKQMPSMPIDSPVKVDNTNNIKMIMGDALYRTKINKYLNNFLPSIWSE